MTTVEDVTVEIGAYARAVADRLSGVLGKDLAGVYLSGSVAQGNFVPQTSDVDIKGVCASPINEATRANIVEALRHESLACPARLLEFTLLTQDAVATPTQKPPYELDLNTGPGVFKVNVLVGEVESHWFVLDSEVTRRHGIAIRGPDPSELFGVMPRAWLLEAQLSEIEWYEKNESTTYQRVLQACRALAHAQDDLLLAKDEGACWAIEHGEDARLITDAVKIRHGGTLELERARIDTIAQHARVAVGQALVEVPGK